MSNPIYDAMGGNDIMTQLQALRNNPVGFLLSRKYNIPDNLSGNPQGIVQHLLNTGQMSQDTYNKLQGQVSRIMK